MFNGYIKRVRTDNSGTRQEKRQFAIFSNHHYQYVTRFDSLIAAGRAFNLMKSSPRKPDFKDSELWIPPTPETPHAAAH